jgi:hypothetical protein
MTTSATLYSPRPTTAWAARPAASLLPSVATRRRAAAPSSLLQASAGVGLVARPIDVDSDPAEHARRMAKNARVRFTLLLGGWRNGWTRARNLTVWMARAIRLNARELGLKIDATGRVLGDHLIAIMNRALEDLSEHPRITVAEVLHVIAAQAPADLRLYFQFTPEDGAFWVGCFHGLNAIAWEAPTVTSAPRHGAEAVDDDAWLVFGRETLARPPHDDDSWAQRPLEDCEDWLVTWIASQPLNAIAYTYDYRRGSLRIHRHRPPFAYRPTPAVLLLDEMGAPLMPSRPTPSLPWTQVYERLEWDKNPALWAAVGPIVYHDTVAEHVDAILSGGLQPKGTEVHLWSHKLAPQRGRRRHDARLFVDVRGAMRRGHLRFFVAAHGVIVCPTPIPVRYLSIVFASDSTGGSL